MTLKNFKSLIKTNILLILGLIILGCLPYVKASKIDSETELSRKPDKSKSEYKVDYKLTSNGILFNVSETETSFDKVRKEKVYKTYKKADIDSLISCSVYGMQTYWRCMMAPVSLFGVGIVISIPIILYDWITYPFYVLFTDSTSVEVEESDPRTKRDIQSPKAKLRLTNQDTKFDKTYSFKDGRLEVPFSEMNVNNLWNSGEENAPKKYYYYFSILDAAGAEVVPKTAFDGVQFRNDQNFTKLSNLQYQKEKLQEYNQCSKKFGLSNIRDGYKYIYDNGMYRNEHELVVQVIIDRVCYSFKGTNGFDGCVSHFKECIGTTRYIDNQNTKYNKE